MRPGLMLSLCLALVLPPPAHAVDVEALSRKSRFDDIKLSPNGDYFAATVGQEDRTSLVILRRSDSQVVGGFNLGKNSVVSDFAWVNPERVLISVADKFGALDQPQLTGELYAMGVDGKSDSLVGYRVNNPGATLIRSKKAELVAAFLVDDLPGDAKNVVVTVMPFARDAYAHAETMDVYSGRRQRVASVPVRRAEFSTDNAGIVRFAAGAGVDNVQKLYYRSTPEADWVLVNDEAETDWREFPIGFSADNKTAYLQREQEKGPDSIVAMNLETMEVHDVLRDKVADPSRIIYRAGTRIPVGVFYADGKPRTAFFNPDVPEAKLYRSLEAAFGGEVVWITSMTADGKLALVRTSSDRNSGSFYLFDTEAKTAQFVLSRRDWLDPRKLNVSEPFEMKARDGLALHGFISYPAGVERKKLPMVVLPHGGPFREQDTWQFDSDVQVLTAAGYAVLQLNYRGSGGYGRDFVDAGARQWGKAMQDDVTDATHWAVEQGIADAGRICIYGASYGAYAALMGVAREPTLYKCAAGYVGVYDLPLMHTTGDIQKRGSGETYLREWLGEPQQLGPVSPNRLADRIKVPVFLAAGGEDERAPIEHSKRMERALKAAGVPVETLYYDSEGHGFYVDAHRREFYTRLLAFLSRSLGGGMADPTVVAGQ